MQTTPLSTTQRHQSISSLKARTVDVLVIGGGVTGAGAALDAVTRGFDVGLIEARDWASGTSSRSSKLIHGGLRYLQMLDFKLVRESLTERGRLLTTIAPHLVEALPFLYPLTHRVWERAYVGAGLALYDALSFAPGVKRGVPLHRHLGARGVQRLFPDLADSAAVGAIRYYDARVDDARLVTTIVRTAVSHGALAASRTQALGYLSRNGTVTGVRALDLESGEEFEIHARHVIGATGVWTDETESLEGLPAHSDAAAATTPNGRGLKVRASKGMHIVVPGDRISGKAGVIAQTEKSVLFIIPWDGYWVIGTTDTDWTQGKAHPVANATDVDYLLEHANSVLKTTLTTADVMGTYAGLRPLLQPVTDEAKSTAKVSREHTAATPAPGLTVIAGGKFTTYRVMAEDVVDQALGAQAKANPSITADLPVVGAEGFAVRRRQRTTLARRYGWDVKIVDHLLGRYGGLIDELLELIDADPSLGKPLPGAERYLKAEIVYAASSEGALHVEDVLTRRTRLSYDQRERGIAVAPAVAELMAPVLGWDAAQQAAEVQSYRDRTQAELAAQLEPDDAHAAAIRESAAEIMPTAAGAVR